MRHFSCNRKGVLMRDEQNSKFLIFSSENNYYAVYAQKIERVMRVVETTSVPNSPFILFGVFDLQGKILPVISLRRLFSLNEKEIELEDMLIILHMGERLIAILSDHVLGVFECQKDETADTDELFSGLVPEEIVKFEDMLIPIIDIEKLIDEEIFNHIAAHSKTDKKEALHV